MTVRHIRNNIFYVYKFEQKILSFDEIGVRGGGGVIKGEKDILVICDEFFVSTSWFVTPTLDSELHPK